MKTLAFAILALLLVLVAAVAFAPASIVDGRVAAATGGRLRLADATGTVWNGAGALGDVAGTWRVPVTWKLAWPSLLRGAADITLAPPPGAAFPRGMVTVTPRSVELRDLTVELPARALAATIPGRVPVTLGGMVTVTAPDFAWTGAQGRGAASARWRDARLATAGGVATLGSVDVALKAEGDGITGRVTSSGGDVRIDGTVALSGTSLAIDAVVASQPGAPETVTRALAMAGTADSSGAVRLTWRGATR